jgi:hypothetical protein
MFGFGNKPPKELTDEDKKYLEKVTVSDYFKKELTDLISDMNSLRERIDNQKKSGNDKTPIGKKILEMFESNLKDKENQFKDTERKLRDLAIFK